VPNPVKSKSQGVYERLRAAIISGEFGGGYRLVMDQLAGEYGVSAVPVREAVRRLEAEGLVTFIPNVGAQVAGIDAAEYAETMEALAYLDGVTTALAVGRLSADQLDSAALVNARMKEIVAAEVFLPEDFRLANREFHRILTSGVPNRRLVLLRDREWDRLGIIRGHTYSVDRERGTESVVEHDRLLDLLRGGAPAHEVSEAVTAHRLATMRHYLAVRAGGPSPS
jgi:DNA-binding GntR family transcriptional regulator